MVLASFLNQIHQLSIEYFDGESIVGNYPPQKKANPIGEYLTRYVFHEDMASYNLSFELDGIQIPLLIKSSNSEQNDVAFLIDGFIGQTPYTDFYWEYLQREKLKSSGFDIMSINSYEWWKNSTSCSKELIEQIVPLFHQMQQEEEE